MSGYHRLPSRGNIKGHHDPLNSVNSSDGAQIQNVQSARVYIFGDADCTEDEINTDDTGVGIPELRPRGAARKVFNGVEPENTEPEFFERPIGEEDTLQSLSLKYGCPMSELKRMNNLIRDQDFFGRTSLRIPLRRHGLLSELVQEQLSDEKSKNGGAGNNRPGRDVTYEANDYGAEEQDLSESDDSERNKLLVRTLSIRDTFGSQSKDAVEFLKKMDNDIKGIVSTANSRKETLEEVRDTLTCKSIHPLSQQRSIFDGVDCGMRWWSVLFVTFLVLLGGPLLYFLYYEYVNKDS